MMAIGEHKHKSPYHGVLPASFFMILVPVGVYLLMRALLCNGQSNASAEFDEASARAIGLGVGFVFHLSLMVAGVCEESFKVVVRRVGEFFADLKISFKIAWSCYTEDIRENGVAFWILFGIVVINFCFFWDGLKFVLDYLLN